MTRNELFKTLAPYVSADDTALDRLTFLKYVRDRIADDIEALESARAKENR